ncbi:hypothetical protein HDU97_000062 [Phlyctochytrium planicorne]|nr:hypothetical protein HDU97_000062 [Phlyctochytrium planicorne]
MEKQLLEVERECLRWEEEACLIRKELCRLEEESASKKREALRLRQSIHDKWLSLETSNEKENEDPTPGGKIPKTFCGFMNNQTPSADLGESRNVAVPRQSLRQPVATLQKFPTFSLLGGQSFSDDKVSKPTPKKAEADIRTPLSSFDQIPSFASSNSYLEFNPSRTLTDSPQDDVLALSESYLSEPIADAEKPRAYMVTYGFIDTPDVDVEAFGTSLDWDGCGFLEVSDRKSLLNGSVAPWAIIKDSVRSFLVLEHPLANASIKMVNGDIYATFVGGQTLTGPNVDREKFANGLTIFKYKFRSAIPSQGKDILTLLRNE